MFKKTALFLVSFFLLFLVNFTVVAQKVSDVASELQSKMI